jgi:uncharacterized membrane protein YphA (DoxX/SURF4 family)
MNYATASRPVEPVATPPLHVDYVTDPPDAAVDAVAFALGVLSEPLNATLVVGGTVGVVALLTWVFVRQPTVPDFGVLADTLDGYRRYVPWMLRLSLGLPLVGAGFSGYLFSPAVPVEARLFQVGLGFLLLFGLATRLVAGIGLAAYLGALAFEPGLVLAFEYVPGFLAIALVGSGEPSADHMLNEVARADGTFYGEVDPVHRLAARFDGLVDPVEQFVPVVLRVGVGLSFVYLGLTQKLADPARALSVVEKYDLTAVVPVDPGLWVLGAGLVEMGVGTLLIAGYLTRASAAVAFLMLTLTLFGLPDDPVLAHVTLFGLLSAVFTLGSGRASVDAWVATADERERTAAVS